MDFYDVLQNHIAAFLLMLVRITGIFIVAPFFGSRNVPMYVRVGAALAITLALYPAVHQASNLTAPPTVLGYAMAVLTELFVGWLIGYVSYVVLSAIHLGGKIMDMQVGFAIVNVMDPTSGQQIPLIGSFLYNLTLIVFVVTNGHHMLLSALSQSFTLVPMLGASVDGDLVRMIIDFVAGVFSTGMKIAMPVLFANLLSNVALAILARTMPQLNIFVVGVPMHIIVGIFVLSIMLPFYVLFLDVLFNEMYGHVSAALKTLI